MTVSEAQRRANMKWDQAHRADYWRATIVFPAAEKNRVMQQAAARGLSLSDYIRGLVDADAAPDQQQTPPPEKD